MLILCALFFVSGFSALIYELLWLRQLGLVFGNTVQAAAAVLTAFMAGLAIGAHALSRRAERSSNPVRLFGRLELTIGFSALLMPLLFQALRVVYRFAYQHVSSSPAVLTPLRFALAVLLLIVPTFCMGGSLPVLAKGLVRRGEHFSARLGLLYGINTLGATAGLLISGFVLIAALGLKRTNFVAVAGNLAAGVLALVLARGRAGQGAGAGREEPVASRPAPLPWPGRIALLAIGVSGFVALAMEVVWFRALILVFGSTTYSFSAMLSVFLVGIATGSLALSGLSDRLPRPLYLLALAQIGIGLYTLVSLPWFNYMPMFFLRFLREHGMTWPALIGAEGLITLLFLLGPTLLMGFSFVTAARAVSDAAGSTARPVGEVYTANTIGAVLGSVAGGFLLLPALGAERSLLLLGGVSLVAGFAWVLAGSAGAPRGLPALTIIIAGVFGLWAALMNPGWDRKLMSAGPYFAPWNFLAGDRIILRERLYSEELLFHQEGVVTSVSVTRTDDQQLYFSSDGKVEADTTARSMMLQRMMGHLPLLFHPDPKRALNIGLGAGVTFGALSCHPLERFEVVEIEPAVRKVAEIFGPRNHFVLRREDARVTMGDGRNHLFCTGERYDVITSDPFEPVYAGANHLYTVEHFRQAKDRLARGGILCQYLPLYELSRQDFSAIVRSFAKVFPDSVMFFTGDDTILLGFRDRVRLEAGVLAAKFEIPAVRASLQEIGIAQPEQVFGMFVADLTQPTGLFGEGPLNTDDRPVVEYSAPRNALRYTSDDNQRLLLENFTPVPARCLAGFSEEQIATVHRENEGLRMALQANGFQNKDAQRAYDLLMEALDRAPNNPVIRDALVRTMMQSADGLRAAGQLTDAAYQYQIVLNIKPNEFMALYNLVDLGMRSGNREFTSNVLDRALMFHPNAGLLLGLKGRFVAQTATNWAEARSWLERAVRASPWKYELWSDYASFARAAGDIATAVPAQDEARRRAYEAGQVLPE